MNLNYLFNLHGNTSAANADTATDSLIPTGPPADMSSFVAGQTIQGEVVAMKNNELLLLLENGGQINAKLAKDIPLLIGQLITMEVKSNNGSRLVLSPLFENMGHDANALKALSEAGLPTTAKNLEMVALLMREGMSIDKAALQSLSRQLYSFPGSDVATLAYLNRLGLPVTNDNLSQLKAYQSYEHKLNNAISTVSSSMMNDIGVLADGNDAAKSEAIALFKNILTIFAQQEAATGSTPLTGLPQMTAGQLLAYLQEEGATINALTDSVNIKNTTNDRTLINPHVAPNVAIHITQQGETHSTVANPPAVNGFAVANPFVAVSTPPTPTSTPTLINLLAQAVFDPQGVINDEQLVKLLGQKEFQTLMTKDISDKWLLKPEELLQDKSISEHFRQILTQTSQLAAAYESTGLSEGNTAQTIQNLNANINFINQLNQAFTYLQLPLKLGEDSTHGELFIYTNKENLARGDGNLSALLHLDMEHLGAMDIHVTMQNKNVTAGFYLQNERIIDLVSRHIETLTKRLEKRGYFITSNFTTRTTVKRPIDEILTAGKNSTIIGSYSFDARA